MSKDVSSRPVARRRSMLKAGFAIGAMQVASPFVVKSFADEPVKIGLDNPLTGTYAALGKNELIGAQLAVEQINAKGGIHGRQVELLVEDSTSGDTATAVQKALKLIERDQVNFLLGNINSALAQAMAKYQLREGRVPYRARRPHRHRHRYAAAIGTCSVSATRRGWRPTRSLSCCSIKIRQEMVLHHHRLCVWSFACRRASRRASRRPAAPSSAPTSRRSAPPTSPPI